ncbi:MAG: hypothetical protein AB1437_08705 [Pseudomonadota bacterium]
MARFLKPIRPMHSTPRFTINRHLVILVPRQPALDWVNSVDPEPPGVTLDELREDQNAFLVPDIMDGQEDAQRWVQRRWAMFFESFLVEWYLDPSLWPQKRSAAMFKKWFDVQYHSMVWDLAAGEPLGYEDWDVPEDEQ